MQFTYTVREGNVKTLGLGLEVDEKTETLLQVLFWKCFQQISSLFLTTSLTGEQINNWNSTNITKLFQLTDVCVLGVTCALSAQFMLHAGCAEK